MFLFKDNTTTIGRKKFSICTSCPPGDTQAFIDSHLYQLCTVITFNFFSNKCSDVLSLLASPTRPTDSICACRPDRAEKLRCSCFRRYCSGPTGWYAAVNLKELLSVH